MKRWGLFLLVNLAIIVMLGAILKIFGVEYYLQEMIGMNNAGLLVFCFIFGMSGSIASLFLSKKLAMMGMGVKLIEANDPKYGRLYNSVAQMAKREDIKMPEVGIYYSAELNAFATGASRNNSLVAVSEGLYNRMSPEELDAVLAHEVSHIANGDMVTMTLLQGVLNTFVMFGARILARALSRDSDGKGSYFAYIGFVILFEIVFGLLATLIVAAFSRYREYRADAGGAKLSSATSMANALRVLQKNYEMIEDDKKMATFKISSKVNILSLFSTHPPLEKRIARLEKNQY